jgi:hypothetical protein
MVLLESSEVSQHLAAFRGLEALYAPNQIINLPQGTVFSDRLRAAPDVTGVEGGSTHEFTIPASAGNTYSIRGVDNFAVVNMTAHGGGFQSANVYQWAYLMPNIRSLNLPYVIILIDQNPRNFSRRMEYELFHLAMTELINEGRTVFVISPTANDTSLTMRDGVRYINANSIRFFTGDGRIWWQG